MKLSRDSEYQSNFCILSTMSYQLSAAMLTAFDFGIKSFGGVCVCVACVHVPVCACV